MQERPGPSPSGFCSFHPCCIVSCVYACVSVCECPVVLCPSAQAASEPWPRLVTAQLQTPSGDTAVLPALCRQQRLDFALCVPTYQPRLPVLWDTRSCCQGTRVSTGTSVPASDRPHPSPHHTCFIHGEPPSKSAFSWVSS